MQRSLGVLFFALISATMASLPAHAQDALRDRRARAMARVPDGLILLHAVSGLKRWEDAGLRQDPAFYYFTGLANARRAILALDGTTNETWLFVGDTSSARTPDLGDAAVSAIKPGPAAQAALGIDHVVSWTGFIPFVEARRAARPSLVVYADRGGQTGLQMGGPSNPDGLASIENPYLLWSAALHQRWSDLDIRDAFSVLDGVREIKSSDEIVLLRRAAASTAQGFWAGVAAIAPGKSQRAVEGAVISGCLRGGADGLSLWPWVRSGPFALPARLFEEFSDYANLNRTMQVGELVRLDVGCDVAMYKGDFGRTIPVSGHFTDAQRETLDLLNGAYLAGVAELRPGASSATVFDATARYVANRAPSLRTDMAKEAARNALAHPRWSLHGLGLDMAEGVPAVFSVGNVLCYEPLFVGGGEALFVEDTFVITANGYEVINPSLPYAPADIERAMTSSEPTRASSAAAGAAPAGSAVTASYTVSIEQHSRDLVVEAKLSAAPARLVMIPSAPTALPDGWAQFIDRLHVLAANGRDIAVQRSGDSWTVAMPGAQNVTLRYHVRLQVDDTLPNGEPRWIRDRTMSEAGYAKDWGVFLTGGPLLVLPDSVASATLEFRVPRGWSVAASWDPVPGSTRRYALVGPTGVRDGMFVAGDIALANQSVDGIRLDVAFGGSAIRREAPRIEGAIAKSLSSLVAIMGRVPQTAPGVPLRHVLIVAGEDGRRDFVGGGLSGTNISMLVAPDASWQFLEGLIAHELFHLWNGYSFRNKSPEEAWFTEGVTEYYAFEALRRSGAITAAQWRDNLGAADHAYRADSGLGSVSMTAAGRAKFAHRGLTYAGGYVAAACLDADMKHRTNGRVTLDSLMRKMQDRYSRTNRYDTDAIARLVSEVVGEDYSPWFGRYISGTEALPRDACGVAQAL